MGSKRAGPIDAIVGRTIRALRLSKSISQGTLGRRLGVSFQQVQKYENGANRVSFSRLVQVARALDCRVTDLTDALDAPQAVRADFEFLKLMTLPGAVDLLKRYEGLAPESRRLLVDLLDSLAPAAA